MFDSVIGVIDIVYGRAYHPANFKCRSGEFDNEAIEVMREAIRMDSNNAVLRSNLSIVLTNVKSWGEAEIEIREAIRLDPTSSKYPDLLRRMLNKEVLRF